ncbi:type II secretion system F family protein [Candidatus Parcubacteria bacterium]|nr:type II secretion system F family protein [Patescibacteria group bacterium]MCG2688476.1 type II secretion system F family protein [Candidatus Parcubacteria bacterium]
MKFNYQARTKEGDIQAGAIEAASKEAAANVLQGHRLIVTFLEKAGEEPFYSRSLKIFEKVSRKDLVLFLRELSTMFKSEVTLIEALQAIGEETKNNVFKETIFKVGEEIEGGTSFSDALATFPKLFPPLYINLIKSGESSGKLSEVLEYLADHMEREYDLTRKIASMTVYPAFVLVTFTGVLIVMSIVVIPKLTLSLGIDSQDLPLVTKIVIGFTTFLRKYIILIVAAVIGLIISLQRYSKTEIGKANIDAFMLKLPLIGNLLKMIYLTRFAENFSTLISGGLPITKSLEILSGVVGNQSYKDIINETKEEVRRGEMVSKVLKKYPQLVPSFFSQMVLVGERTGRLSETLMNIVVFYEKEIEQEIQMLLSLLEPVLIIVLGGGVGVLIASVLLPMYQMGSIGL